MRREYLLILLEFQSKDDRWMALRILTYTGLLYQELVRNEAPGIADGRLPPVLPIVLYNGTEPWTATREMRELISPAGPWLARFQPAQDYLLLDVLRVAADDLPGRNLLHAVAALEQSRSFEDVLRVREALQLWLRDPRAAELQRAFVDWMRQIAERVAPAGAVVPPVRTWGGCQDDVGRTGSRMAPSSGSGKDASRALNRVLSSSGAAVPDGGGALRRRHRRTPGRRSGPNRRPRTPGRGR